MVSTYYYQQQLDSEEGKFKAGTEEPQQDFETLAAAALDNARIDPHDHLRDARAAQEAGGNLTNPAGPAVVQADGDEIVYKIIFNLPDAGLAKPNPPMDVNQQLGDAPIDAPAC